MADSDREIPNSQPSSPAVSFSGDTPQYQCTKPDDQTETQQLDDDENEAAAPTLKTYPLQPTSDSNPTDTLPSPTLLHGNELKNKIGTQPSSSPHKPLITTLPAQPTRRRNTHVASTHSSAYLEERNKTMLTTLSSTQAILLATLDDLSRHLPSSGTLTLPSPRSNNTAIPPETTIVAAMPELQASSSLTSAPTQHRSVTSTSPAQLSTQDNERLASASAILANHVKTLSKYNAVKDIAMDMLGILAEQQGKTMKEIMMERGISEDD